MGQQDSGTNCCYVHSCILKPVGCTDLMGDEVRSMLQLLPTTVRDAIIVYFLGWDLTTDDAEQDEARQTR